MNQRFFTVFFLLCFAGTPLVLALSQDVPTQSTYQLIVLLASLVAFGLMLGIFWLSRLMPRDTVDLKYKRILSWHKWIGYSVGAFFLVHPVLMIARRFWVVESTPLDNLKLMLGSPLLRTGIAAWVLLVCIVVLAINRKRFRGKTFRLVHGALAALFVVPAVWHVITVGAHSNWVLSAFWILMAAGVIAAYANRLLKERIHT